MIGWNCFSAPVRKCVHQDRKDGKHTGSSRAANLSLKDTMQLSEERRGGWHCLSGQRATAALPVLSSGGRREVRQMASKAVSGQLDLLIQYPPSKWTSEIDDENIKGALESSGNTARIKACQPGEQEWPQAEKETEDQKPVYSTEGERDLEDVLK
ncbi:UNVERIFIED_CONTAM: hypothetical protein K2H54_033551 [Gekko kuhli]